jgi:hypothetical protein
MLWGRRCNRRTVNGESSEAGAEAEKEKDFDYEDEDENEDEEEVGSGSSQFERARLPTSAATKQVGLVRARFGQ